MRSALFYELHRLRDTARTLEERETETEAYRRARNQERIPDAERAAIETEVPLIEGR